MLNKTKTLSFSGKRICLLFCFSFFGLHFAFGQGGTWTWINGDSAINNYGNYGIKGVPSPSNKPSALYEAYEWTDLNGNFWLYGGVGPTDQVRNDLWKYDLVNNEWTWMTGTQATSDTGYYGIQGVSSPLNRPSGRGFGGCSWTDLDNNLWMYGGGGLGNLSDLWKYSIASNEWTWMKGTKAFNQQAIFGSIGVPDTANNPDAIVELCASWTDDNGDLWFFGGNNSNTMWRYTISNNAWTWMKGSQTQGSPAITGTRGVEDSANTPGAHNVYCRWKDKGGNLWLLSSALMGGFYNTLWRFNPSTNNWTWMNSSPLPYSGYFGDKCVTSPLNAPALRWENRAAWRDVNGNFWVIGGAGINGVCNDLWMYCISSNEWTWEGNDSTFNSLSNWGSLGIASPSNKPSGRGGAIGWSDNRNHLYLFGGNDLNGQLNDLWIYTIDSLCSSCVTIAPPVISFSCSDTVICANDCINLTNKSSDANSYNWIFSGGSPSSSTDQNPQVCYLDSGIYNITLIASNSAGSDTLSIKNYITVNPAPPAPNVADHPGIAKDTLICSSNPAYISYQWYQDSTLISGATDTVFIAYQNGNYNLVITGTNGCKISAGINVIIGVQNYMSDHIISLSPNPTGSNLQLTISDRQNGKGEMMINIYNVLGQVCQQSEINNPKSEINVASLPSGIYFVQLIGEKERWVGRFVKE